MTFTLNTHDVQSIVLALVCNDSIVLHNNQETVDNLVSLFASVNRMCNEQNNYTVQVAVTD